MEKELAQTVYSLMAVLNLLLLACLFNQYIYYYLKSQLVFCVIEILDCV